MGAETEILELEERLRQADARPDPDTSGIFQELFADDVLLVGPGGVFDVAGVLAGHRPPRKQNFDEVTVTDRTVRDLGEVVLVTCRTDYRRGARNFALRMLRVWKKRDGAWKVVVGVDMEPPRDGD